MPICQKQRLQQILSKLQSDQQVQAKDLAVFFGVSMETIRKDLTFLCQQGLAKKIYGGAMLADLEVETSLEYRNNHQNQKNQIAKAVMKLVADQHSLFLDAGTTCLACVHLLNQSAPPKDVLTCSLEAAQLLDASLHNVFVLPGRKRKKNQSLVGFWTEDYIRKTHVNVCLLATAGLKDANGPTSHSYSEISTKKAMIEQSDLVYVLADSSKFFENGLHTIAFWDQIDAIITDHPLPQALDQKLSKQVQILIAADLLENASL